MFKVCIIVYLITTILGSPHSASRNDEIHVVKMVRDWGDDNSYRFVYELSDGQSRSESGAPKQIGDERPVVSKGHYSFVAPNGQTHWVHYTGDENGYHSRTGMGGPIDDEDEPGSGFMPYPE